MVAGLLSIQQPAVAEPHGDEIVSMMFKRPLDDSAKEQRRTVEPTLSDIRANMAESLAGLRQLFERQLSQLGSDSQRIGSMDLNMHRLIDSIVQLNALLTPEGGTSVIPIGGPRADGQDENEYYQERFDQLRSWLSTAIRFAGGTESFPAVAGLGDPTALLNPEAINQLQMRLTVVMGASNAHALASGLATSPPPVIHSTTPPGATGDRAANGTPEIPASYVPPPAAPPRRVTPPTPALIPQPAAQPPVRPPPREAPQAEQPRAEQPRAEQPQTETPLREFPATIANASNDLVGFVHPIYTSVSTIATDEHRTPEDRALALRIANGLAQDMWLLGEGPRQRMLADLVQAAVLLGAGTDEERSTWLTRVTPGNTTIPPQNSALAGQHFRNANQIFTQEQTYYANLLQTFVINPRGALVTLIGQAVLDGVLPSDFGGISTSTTDSNGRSITLDYSPTHLQVILQQRSTEASTLLAESNGRLSFYDVFARRQAAEYDSQVVPLLIATARYANRADVAPNLQANNGALQRTYVERYAVALASVLAPDYNIFRVYPVPVRNAMIQEYIRSHPPTPPMSTAAAETAVRDMLMTNRQFTLETSRQSLILALCLMAPNAESQAADRLTNIITSLEVSRIRYMRYFSSENPNDPRLRAADEPEPYPLRDAEGEPISENVLLNDSRNYPYHWSRVRTARDLLINALDLARASGISEDSPYITNATQWIANLTALEETIRQANIEIGEIPAAASDAYVRRQAILERPDVVSAFQRCDEAFEMALSLLASATGQTFATHSPFRQNSASTVPRSVIDMGTMAETLYQWTFTPGIDPFYHTGLPRHIAERAISALAPPVVGVSDTVAERLISLAFNYPEDEEITDSQEAATITARRWVNLILSLRSSSAEGSSLELSTTALPTLLGAGRELNPVIGRYAAPTEASPVDTPPLLFDFPGILTDVPLSNQTTSDGQRYERIELEYWGHLYSQLQRLNALRLDPNAPACLRLSDADYNALRQRVEQLTRDYAELNFSSSGGEHSPAQMLENTNAVTFSILDLRIAQITTMLAESAPGALGDAGYTIRDLARSDDPRSQYVRRALAALDVLVGARQRFSNGSGRDHFAPDYDALLDPDEAIMLAENIVVYLAHDFSGMPEPSVLIRGADPVPLGTTYELSPMVSMGRGRYLGHRVTTATAQVTVNVPNQLAQDFMSFCQTHDCDVTFTWIDYHLVGTGAPIVTDEARRPTTSEEIIYVVNPAWNQYSMMDEDRNQPRYIGRVVRNIRLPDGSIGDAVIRIEPSPTGTPDTAWTPSRNADRSFVILFTLVVNDDGTPTLQPSDLGAVTRLPQWSNFYTAIPQHIIPIEDNLSVTSFVIRGRRPTAGRPEE
ncbi:hypothetical protein KKF81_03735 [Candidatus Micrarchaeota archaeon]|nr:hypothetical protein [Candidatus Micrarchaeota archaeon]